MTDQAQLQRIKKTIEGSRILAKGNNEYFRQQKKFLFLTSLTPEDRNVLTALGMPQFEFNILEAYVSRLRGEFALQNPSPVVQDATGANEGTPMAKTISSIFKSIMFKSQRNSTNDKLFKDVLCGRGVVKITTDYCSDKTFNQEIKYEVVRDPTNVGFDPTATLDDGSDGDYAYELIQMKEDEFVKEYPSAKVSFTKLSFLNDPNAKVTWAWESPQKERIVYIAEYFEKEYKYVDLVEMPNGDAVELKEYNLLNEIAVTGGSSPLPEPKQVLNRKILHCIYRYRLIENQVLEIDKTPYTMLPLINFDGDSVFVDGMLNIRSYIHNAIGTQRAKNIVGNSLLNEIQRMRATTLTIPQAAIPDSPVYQQAYIQQEKAHGTYVYKHIDDVGNPLPGPQLLPRTPIPPELMQTFALCSQLAQEVFGTYNSAVGQNQNQLSGAAIIAGASNSNAAAKPPLIKYMSAFNQLLKAMLDLIPLYYNTPRTLPLVDEYGKRTAVMINDPNSPETQVCNLKPNKLDVYVEEGVSYETQKQQALTMMAELAPVIPGLSALLSGKGLPILLSNLSVKGSSELKALSEQQIMEAAAAAKSAPKLPPPQMLQIKKLEMEAAKIQGELDMENKRLDLESLELQTKMVQAKLQAQVALRKAATEQDRTDAQLQIEQIDQEIKIHELLMKKETDERFHDRADLQTLINLKGKKDDVQSQTNDDL